MVEERDTKIPHEKDEYTDPRSMGVKGPRLAREKENSARGFYRNMTILPRVTTRSPFFPPDIRRANARDRVGGCGYEAAKTARRNPERGKGEEPRRRIRLFDGSSGRRRAYRRRSESLEDGSGRDTAEGWKDSVAVG